MWPYLCSNWMLPRKCKWVLILCHFNKFNPKTCQHAMTHCKYRDSLNWVSCSCGWYSCLPYIEESCSCLHTHLEAVITKNLLFCSHVSFYQAQRIPATATTTKTRKQLNILILIWHICFVRSKTGVVLSCMQLSYRAFSAFVRNTCHAYSSNQQDEKGIVKKTWTIKKDLVKPKRRSTGIQ